MGFGGETPRRALLRSHRAEKREPNSATRVPGPFVLTMDEPTNANPVRSPPTGFWITRVGKSNPRTSIHVASSHPIDRPGSHQKVAMPSRNTPAALATWAWYTLVSPPQEIDGEVECATAKGGGLVLVRRRDAIAGSEVGEPPLPRAATPCLLMRWR